MGDQLQLTSGNTSSCKVGAEADIKNLKSFVAYAWPTDGTIQPFDTSGGTLLYDSGDTFNAYQQNIDPVDTMLFSIDVPPALKGFKNALEERRKGCK